MRQHTHADVGRLHTQPHTKSHITSTHTHTHTLTHTLTHTHTSQHHSPAPSILTNMSGVLKIPGEYKGGEIHDEENPSDTAQCCNPSPPFPYSPVSSLSVSSLSVSLSLLSPSLCPVYLYLSLPLSLPLSPSISLSPPCLSLPLSSLSLLPES